MAFNYKQQYAVVVMCKDEPEQEDFRSIIEKYGIDWSDKRGYAGRKSEKLNSANLGTSSDKWSKGRESVGEEKSDAEVLPGA